MPYGDMVNKFIIAYIDDILIYSTNLEQHISRVCVSSNTSLTTDSLLNLKNVNFIVPPLHSWDI